MRLVIGFLILSGSLAQEIQTSRMRADLDFLTSDALEGRLSLTPGADKAAEYIAAEFRKAGLTPAAGDSYLQFFSLAGYRPDSAASSLVITVGGVAEECQRTVDFSGGFRNDIAVSAPAVFAGYGITAPELHYDDYASVDVKGRIVFVFDHEPQENDPHSVFNGRGLTRYSNRRVKAINAQRHGAIAILIADDPLRKHVSTFGPPATNATGKGVRRMAPLQALTDGMPSIPMLSISDRVAAKLLAASGQEPKTWAESVDRGLHPASFVLKDVVVEARVKNEERRAGVSLNVAGLLEGSDAMLKSETILVTGHYDHLGMANGNVYRGANDNASGSVAVMEIARALTHSASRPKRSVLFVVFGSEEEGLLGSYYYADHPLRPLETTRAVLNLDMIARNEEHIPQSVGFINVDKDTSNELQLAGVYPSPDLQKLIRRENAGIGLKVDDKFDHTWALNVLFRCDHFPFLLHDVPAVWFFGGFHPGYHEPSDTVDKLNFPKMQKITRLAMKTALAAADGPVLH